MKTTSLQQGYILIENMLAAVTSGFSAAMQVPEINIRSDQERLIAITQDIASLMQALNLYRQDNQRYPVTEQGLQALLHQPVTTPLPAHWKSGGYIGQLPSDPWGNPYQYLNPGVRGDIEIYSLGANDALSGDDSDTDIRLLVTPGSW